MDKLLKIQIQAQERGVESVQYSGCGFEAEKVAELAPKSDLIVDY